MERKEKAARFSCQAVQNTSKSITHGGPLLTICYCSIQRIFLSNVAVGAEADLDLHICADNVQLLASFSLEEIQEVGDGGQQNTATDSNRLCQLSLLYLQVN